MIRLYRKFFASLIITVILITSVLLIPTFAAASDVTQQTESPTENSSSGIGFYVRAQIPENQIDDAQSYFDLLMQPEARQTIAVEIVNEGASDIVVDVSVISASTNPNGLIDYRTPDIRDETLLYPLSELAKAQQSEIEVPGYSSSTAYVDIEMPEEEFDGVVLGGIVICRHEDMDEQIGDTEQTGSVILNRYSYVLGVKLTETDTIIQPNFGLISVIPEAVNYKAAIVHYLRNSEALIVKNMDVSLIITDQKNNKIIHEDDWTIDMAPNSVIELAAYPKDGELTPGTYTSHIQLQLEGNVFELESAFTIDKEQIKEINGSVITEKSGIPAWVWGIIILLIVLTLVTFLMIIILYKKYRTEKAKANSFK